MIIENFAAVCAGPSFLCPQSLATAASMPATYDLTSYLQEQMQNPQVAAAVERGDAYPHQKFAADFLSRMLPLGGDPHLVQFDCGTGKTGVVSLLCQNMLPHKKVALVTVGQLVFQTGSLVAQTFARQRACQGKTPVAPAKSCRTFLVKGEMFDVALGMYGDPSAPEAGPSGAAGSRDVAALPSEHEAAEEIGEAGEVPRPPPRKKRRGSDKREGTPKQGSLAWLRGMEREYGERHARLLCVVNHGLQGVDRFLEEFDVVICDEAHLYVTLIKRLAHKPALRLVALTATPGANMRSIPWHILSLKLNPAVKKLLGISRVDIVPNKKDLAGDECLRYWRRFAHEAELALERSLARVGPGDGHYHNNVLATAIAFAAGRLKIAELAGDHVFDGDGSELPGPEIVSRCCRQETDEEVKELYRRVFARETKAFQEAVGSLLDAGHPLIAWAVGSRGTRYETGEGPKFRDARSMNRILDGRFYSQFASCHKRAAQGWRQRHLDQVVEAVLFLRPSLFPVIVRVDSLGVKRVAARLREVMDPNDSLTAVCNSQGQWRCEKVRDVVAATEQTLKELEALRTWRMILRLLTLKPKRDLFNRTMEAAGGTVGETIMAYINPRLTNRDVVLTDASMSVGFNIQNSFSSILCTSLPDNDADLIQQIGRMRRMHGWLPITCRMHFRGNTYEEFEFEKKKPGWEAAVV
ncbi:hypothetical protein EBU02_04530 [bacterium]|nr:hypothetical protein [bacterium]